MATLAGMFVLGVIGQAILGFAGRTVRDAVDFRPIRVVDSASGMVVSILAFLLCAWMVLSVAASSSLGPTSEQVRASRGFPLLDQVLAGPGGTLLDDARELLATIDVPSLPFNPATLPPVEDPADVDVSAEAARGGARLGAPGVHDLDPLRVLVAGLGGRGQPRSGGHERPRRGRCRSDHRPLGERPRRPAARAWCTSIPRTTSRSCTCPGSRPRRRRGPPTPRGGRMPWWPATPAAGRLTLGEARVRGQILVADDQGSGSREVHVFRGLVRPGNSGGALLGLDGSVIGLVFANAQDDDQTGFALTEAEVQTGHRGDDGRPPTRSPRAPAGSS